MAGGQRVLDTQARSYTDQQWDHLLNSGDALLYEIETLLDQAGHSLSPLRTAVRCAWLTITGVCVCVYVCCSWPT